jgi:hypothetical protein
MSQPLEYQPLSVLLQDVAGIAVFVGVLFFLLRKSLPPAARGWYFGERPWLVNASVVLLSIAAAILGAWLNVLGFQPRSVVEFVWMGLFSAASATFGYEFVKNLGREQEQRA